MRFIIYGAGAVGSLFGAYLARAGQNVILIGRELHVDKIRRDGLRVKTADDGFVVPLPAVTMPSDIEYQESDIIFLTT